MSARRLTVSKMRPLDKSVSKVESTWPARDDVGQTRTGPTRGIRTMERLRQGTVRRPRAVEPGELVQVACRPAPHEDLGRVAPRWRAAALDTRKRDSRHWSTGPRRLCCRD